MKILKQFHNFDLSQISDWIRQELARLKFQLLSIDQKYLEASLHRLKIMRMMVMSLMMSNKVKKMMKIIT